MVAPASAFERSQLDAGVAELRRLGFEAVYDPSIFDRALFTAGDADTRAAALMRAFDRAGAAAVMAMRGGYGTGELLPRLDPGRIRQARLPFIGYSDLTAFHSYCSAIVGLASVHGPMLEGRFGQGPGEYDVPRFLQSLTEEPLGELAPPGLDVLRRGEAAGPLVGGTLTMLLASVETPYAFTPPNGHVLFLEDVGERPYRIHRMLTQWRQSGRLASASAIVFGQFPKCEEPGSPLTAIDAVRSCLDGFSGPVVFGFPSGHTTSQMISLPFGVHTRVIAGDHARVVLEEAAAE